MNRTFRQQFELTLSLAKRDLKARYKDSVLGFFWSLVHPAFLTLVFWVVFTKILPLPFNTSGVPFWLHMLISVLGWNFFYGSAMEATHSVVSNVSLMKKVRMDAEVFPIATIISNGVHFSLAMVLVVVLMLFTTGVHLSIFYLIPVLLIEIMLTLGCAFYLSALQVYYRDVASVFELGGLALFYITPVLYPVSIAFDRLKHMAGYWQKLYLLNPMAPVMIGIRRATIYTSANPELADWRLFEYLLASGVVALVVLISGWAFFRWLSRDFVDQL